MCDVKGCNEKSEDNVGIYSKPIDPKTSGSLHMCFAFLCKKHEKEFINLYQTIKTLINKELEL